MTIHVVVRGAFQLVQDGREPRALEPGDVVLVGAECDGAPSLRCVAPLDGGAERIANAELLSAIYAIANDAALANGSSVLHLRAADARAERGLSAIVSLLRAALMDASAGQERVARALLEPLLAYVLQGNEREDAGNGEQPGDPRIRRAVERLRANLADAWTVAKLAKAAGLSRAAFARRFLAELGIPPLRYVTELRMERAAQLLAEGDASLAAIAAEIGYESEFAFSRAFKRHTGEAPGVYRRRRRAERVTMRTSCVAMAA